MRPAEKLPKPREAVDSEHGTYALIVRAPGTRCVRAGHLGKLRVRPGAYVYIGSAFGPGGLGARVRHHERIARSPHWHIDYLRPAVRLEEVWLSRDPRPREHQWAGILRTLRGASMPFAGFGASDCGCLSHLFFFETPPSVGAFCRRLRARFPHDPPVECARRRSGALPRLRFMHRS